MLAAPQTKVCSACGVEQPLENFYRHRSKPDGHYGQCKQCWNNYMRPLQRKYRYGLSHEEYETLVSKQYGLCAICQEPVEVLCVDHDHKTGKVRGLLCHNHNTALGLFGDSIADLLAAADYLEAA